GSVPILARDGLRQWPMPADADGPTRARILDATATIARLPWPWAASAGAGWGWLLWRWLPMSKINIKPKGTLEADIRDYIATPYNKRPYLTDAFLGKWADKAALDGLSKEQEDRAEERIRVMREQFEAKIH